MFIKIREDFYLDATANKAFEILEDVVTNGYAIFFHKPNNSILQIDDQPTKTLAIEKLKSIISDVNAAEVITSSEKIIDEIIEKLAERGI